MFTSYRLRNCYGVEYVFATADESVIPTISEPQDFDSVDTAVRFLRNFAYLPGATQLNVYGDLQNLAALLVNGKVKVYRVRKFQLQPAAVIVESSSSTSSVKRWVESTPYVDSTASNSKPATASTSANSTAQEATSANSTAQEAASANSTAQEAAATPANKSWIEIQLLGEDDKPIPNERYRVILSDGSAQEGFLDADGLARVENIDSGTCQVIFPDLDRQAWEKVS